MGAVNLHDVNEALRGAGDPARAERETLLRPASRRRHRRRALPRVLRALRGAGQRTPAGARRTAASRRLVGTISKRDILSVYSLDLLQRGEGSRHGALDPAIDSLVDEVDLPRELVGTTFGESRFRQRYGLALLLVRRGASGSLVPDSGLRFAPGDRLVVFGTPERLARCGAPTRTPWLSRAPPADGQRPPSYTLATMRLALAVLLPGLALAPLALAFVPDPTPAAQSRPPVNEDESRVPPYTLPDPLVAGDGSRVSDAQAWRQRRRPEILELFRANVYGRTPERQLPVRSELRSVARDALAGRAVRKQVTLWFGDSPAAPFLDLLVYRAAGCPGPRAGLPRPELRRQPGGLERPRDRARPVVARQRPGGGRTTARRSERGVSRRSAGPSSGSSSVATRWRRRTTATSTPTSTTASRTACTRSSTARGRRGPTRTSGDRSGRGRGDSRGRSTTWRRTRRSTPRASR